MFSGTFRSDVQQRRLADGGAVRRAENRHARPAHSITFGGPIVEDRTWFFGAGRCSDQTAAQRDRLHGDSVQFHEDEKRFEGKLTQSLRRMARVCRSGYIGDPSGAHHQRGRDRQRDHGSSQPGVPPRSAVADHGALYRTYSDRGCSSKGRVSARRGPSRTRAGSSGTDAGNALLDQNTGNYYWSPGFCGVCETTIGTTTTCS